MSEAGKGSWAAQRHQARALAMQMLFEADFVDNPAHEILHRRLSEDPVPAEVAAFSRELFRGAWQRKAELDDIIARTVPSWPLDQMARVDRNILRLALYEMLEASDVPLRAVINEAVDLAKEYGSDASSRFVNGVLGTVAAREMDPPEASAVAPGEL